MRIGKQDQPYSAISTSTATSIHVRGRDLCRDLVGKMDFTSYFWLLVTGEEPTETQLFFANAVLTAIAEQHARGRPRDEGPHFEDPHIPKHFRHPLLPAAADATPLFGQPRPASDYRKLRIAKTTSKCEGL